MNKLQTIKKPITFAEIMKISGFTIIKNAVKNDYPVVEAISSILPVVDEMIVSVGDSEDNTETLIRSIPSNKIKIVHSFWDPNVRKGERSWPLKLTKHLTRSLLIAIGPSIFRPMRRFMKNIMARYGRRPSNIKMTIG